MSRSPTVLVLVGLLAAACRSSGGAAGAHAAAPPPAAAPAAVAAPRAVGIEPSLIDPAAKPCDDFYAYACGGWLKSFQLPPDKSRWTRGFTDIEERNVVLLRDLAQADADGKADAADRYAGKVGDFWAACMDEQGAERRGPEALRAAWARIDAVSDLTALAREVGALHRQGVYPMFLVTSDQDAKDATQVIGAVVQGGLTLPDRDYYLKSDARSATIQADYRAYVARMLTLAGVPAARAERDGETVFALERRMAEAQWSRTELRDPQKTYHRLELAGLEKAMPRFAWPAYLESLGHPGLTAFEASTPQYLARLDELLGSAPIETWRIYLRWKLLSAMSAARALPKAFVEERFAFESKDFTGAKQQEPRWKHCVQMTTGALGEAIGQAYVRRYFGEDGKQKSAEVISGVEGAMGRDLDGLPWMDAATRKRAREKLDHVVNKVGYPDAWRSYDALQVDRGSFFASVLAANAFEVNRQLDKVGKPLDRNEWHMPPTMVNAYYDPSMNEMVFPAGILQPPFFTRGAADAVNYGAIGMVMGHELTHGFDDQGRQYDAFGNLVDWWSPQVSKEFDRRAQCVVDQYSGYAAVDDVKLNGRLTLGENIADLGGLKMAFAAYEASRAGRGAEPAVAGFTPEQAFFVAFAQGWCTQQRPELTRVRAVTDPHAPPWWRVNGPLSNLPEFQRAFACPADAKMVRAGAKRCEVW